VDTLNASPVCVAAERIGRQARLSEREHDVLDLLACGADDKSIAAQLKVSHRTVRSHVSALFVKLRVRNRTEVALTGLWTHLRTCEACRRRLEGRGSPEASHA
jgi:DNA-binding NarL/FixJ family response regulator